MDDILHCNEPRTKVCLRLHMSERPRAKTRVDLPADALTVSGRDPSILWVGPDQWLFVSDTCQAKALVSDLEDRLTGLVCSVTDVSAGQRCYKLEHPDFRRLLAAGSGLDFEDLDVGQCARTRFAQVPLIVVPLHESACELYVDTSFDAYVRSWIRHAAFA